MDANNNQKDVDLVTVAESTIQQSLKHLGQIQTKSVDWKYTGKWLRSGIVTYTTPNSTAEKSWELVGRTTRQKNPADGVDGVDGVDIVALLSNYSKTTTTKESDKAIILVVNYRPPVKKPSLEFPAGLIDKGETPKEAALRELKEETGFTGTVRSVSDPLFVDPWKSTENFHLVTIDVDAAHTSNVLLTQELDEDENLVPIILPLKGLLSNLNKLRTKYDLAIEGKLYGFAQALSFTENSNWA